MTFAFLLAWVLRAMSLLVPSIDHSELANVIAHVVDDARPLFANDADRLRTAAVVVAVSFRESHFQMHAKSKTRDHCAMQIHDRPELADDPVECFRVGLAMLRDSVRTCPEHPIAHYAEGPGGCTSTRAQKISRDRMALAAWLVRSVAPQR